MYYLEKISIVVVVDENPEFLNDVKIFLDLDLGFLEPLSQLSVVGRWDVKELSATGAKIGDRRDDVIGPKIMTFYFSLWT